MKSQKNKILKKWNLKKKESSKKIKTQKKKWNLKQKKNKKNANKTFSELKNFRTQSMSVSDYVSFW